MKRKTRRLLEAKERNRNKKYKPRRVKTDNDRIITTICQLPPTIVSYYDRVLLKLTHRPPHEALLDDFRPIAEKAIKKYRLSPKKYQKFLDLTFQIMEEHGRKDAVKVKVKEKKELLRKERKERSIKESGKTVKFSRYTPKQD